MSKEHTITLINHSGAIQKYALFSKPPMVTGRVEGQIWPSVLDIGLARQESTTTFTIREQYYAVIGSLQGHQYAGGNVYVIDNRPVEFGAVKDDGRVILGTALDVVVVDDRLQFSETHLPDSSSYGAFTIRTGKDSGLHESTKRSYVVGLGGSNSDNSLSGPMATFIPEPEAQYQIRPTKAYCIATGDFKKGALVDITKTGVTYVDFDTSPSRDVVITHDRDGHFIVQH
ncbi:hypothetical protein F66182_3426 [Fusarium sp. NRRL 66182]|nr:hypothetical protein F66182_3426 [Fusarium sp. NRRL 66182]